MVTWARVALAETEENWTDVGCFGGRNVGTYLRIKCGRGGGN